MHARPSLSVSASRRATLGALAGALTLGAATALLTGCAGLAPRRRIHINVVGLDPLPGQSMEVRLTLRLRIQNPNDDPIDFDGIALELDFNDALFATGVSDRKGSVPRYSETVLEIPVSVSAVAMLRQIIGLLEDKPTQALPYTLRGRLGGAAGGMHFSDTGTLALPNLLKTPPAKAR